MQLLKRKILLENYIERTTDSPNYGQLTATDFYIKIPLTQKVDNMGMFTDIPFIASSTSLKVEDFFRFGRSVISSTTESKLSEVRSYSLNQPYQVGFDTSNQVYTNFSGATINGVDKVTNFGDKVVYVIDVNKNDGAVGTSGQTSGILYEDITGTTLANVTYVGEGWNQTNTSYSALTKEEYLFGIVSPPEVKNDIFIDRGITPVMEKHLRLSEIRNLGQLERYGNGFYSLKKQ